MSVRYLTLGSIALALSACSQQPRYAGWDDQPNEPRVWGYLYETCLTNSKGPQATQYNDWDEAIAECKYAAFAGSRYCEKPLNCSPGMNSREDVLAMLPKEPSQ